MTNSPSASHGGICLSLGTPLRRQRQANLRRESGASMIGRASSRSAAATE